MVVGLSIKSCFCGTKRAFSFLDPLINLFLIQLQYSTACSTSNGIKVFDSITLSGPGGGGGGRGRGS